MIEYNFEAGIASKYFRFRFSDFLFSDIMSLTVRRRFPMTSTTLPAPKVMKRKFIRMRERNQITLPQEIISAMAIGAGDFFEVILMEDNSIHLKRTLLITSVNSAEARIQEVLADKDIADEKYETFDSADELMERVAEKREDKREAAVAAGIVVAAAAVGGK
jgi:bifunctional DNA-binding transcriptional regulator/antitoxin component of YhaV-PrlF toxin-antitoxin module